MEATLALFTEWQRTFLTLAPHADAIVRTEEGRRRVTSAITVNVEHIPHELIVHVLNATAFCPGTQTLIDTALREGYHIDAERITCPVRVVWGTADTILPWPSSADRYRHDWLPQADWVELDGVGHCPQLDVPLETAQLILGLHGRLKAARRARPAFAVTAVCTAALPYPPGRGAAPASRPPRVEHPYRWVGSAVQGRAGLGEWDAADPQTASDIGKGPPWRASDRQPPTSPTSTPAAPRISCPQAGRPARRPCSARRRCARCVAATGRPAPSASPTRQRTPVELGALEPR